MKAGKELDALIHEKIFGKCGHVLAVYKKDNRDWTDDYTTYRCKKCKTETFRGLSYSEGKTVCPHYSTNIVDAWLVVEKLRGKGYEVEVFSCNEEVETTVYSDGILISHIENKSLMLSVCLSALRACGVEVEG